jgi:hypothetical protein
MDNSFTTADDGLDPTGWYPGKKHGFLKNLGRVTSMGIYSPDNRMASKLNIQKLETRGQNQEGVRHAKELHQLALDSLKDYYAKAHPEWDPEKVSQMSASAFASKFLADTEENNARGANAMVNKEKSKGILPRAAEVAIKGQTAMEAEADASTARNRNVEANERGRAPMEMDAGAREIMSQINMSGAKSAEAGAQSAEADNRKRKATAAKTFDTPFKAAQFDDMSIDSDKQKLMDENAKADWMRTVESQTRPITGNTMVEDARRQAIDVQNSKLDAGAMNTLLQDPTMARAAAASKLNRNALTVPYGGTVVPVVPVDQGTAIQGETRHPDVVEYGEKINPVNGQKIPIVTRKTYGAPGTNMPPSTADFNGLTGRRAPITVDTNILNSIIGGR